MPDPMPKLILMGVGLPVTPLEVNFEFSSGSPNDGAVAITPLVERFVKVGKLGGYPLPSVSADRSTMDLLSGPTTVANRLSYQLDARNIDSRAFQVLRLMVGALPAQGFLVGTIVVREPRSRSTAKVELPFPTDDAYYDHYPDISDSVPFIVEWVDLPGKSRRYLVELSQPVDPDHLQAVADRVYAWWTLVDKKGFVLPTDVPVEEIESSFGAVTQFDEVTIEIAVDLFQSAETAWKVLTNLLDSQSRTAVAVAKVVIE